MKKGKEKEGISLIVLVITIIVIIILAAAVILTLNKNNPIEEANKARYESDVANMQAVFTNTVAKVMAQNQGTIQVNAGELNSVKSGGSSTEGIVNYTLDNPLDSSNENGTIIFNTGTNTATTYYTGRKLPLYSSGQTTWYVDSEGVILLKINDKEYGTGVASNITVDRNSIKITLKDGEEIPIEGVDKGTELKITFTASIKNGIITNVTPGTLQNNNITYTTTGTEKEVTFKITGKIGNDFYETTYTIPLKDYYIKTEFESGDIAKVPSTFYGAEVTGYTCPSTGVSKWRIFYADTSNIYLIADDYISHTNAPNEKNRKFNSI